MLTSMLRRLAQAHSADKSTSPGGWYKRVYQNVMG
jgi:hypothetical protein